MGTLWASLGSKGPTRAAKALWEVFDRPKFSAESKREAVRLFERSYTSDLRRSSSSTFNPARFDLERQCFVLVDGCFENSQSFVRDPCTRRRTRGCETFA